MKIEEGDDEQDQTVIVPARGGRRIVPSKSK
jgi:hypothetical protein